MPWNMIGFSALGLGLVEQMFWRCWLRQTLIIGADLYMYLQTNVAVSSGQVVKNSLSMTSQKVDMTEEFVHTCRKEMRFMMVSLTIAKFAVYYRILGPGEGALENLPKTNM